MDASSADDARRRAGNARRPPGTARLPRDGATMHRGDGPARARPARAAPCDPPARAHALMPPCRRECPPARGHPACCFPRNDATCVMMVTVKRGFALRLRADSARAHEAERSRRQSPDDARSERGRGTHRRVSGRGPSGRGAAPRGERPSNRFADGACGGDRRFSFSFARRGRASRVAPEPGPRCVAHQPSRGEDDDHVFSVVFEQVRQCHVRSFETNLKR